MMQNTTTSVFTTALVTVADGGTLQGNALLSAVTVQKGGTMQGGIGLTSGTLRLNTNLTLQQGATVRCMLGPSAGGTQISVKGNIAHNADTLLIVVPEGRQLAVGDEVQVFAEGFAKATGDVIVRCESQGYVYEFDTSTLNIDGKVRVASKTDAVRGVVADGSELVDVYSPDGILLRRQVPVSESLKSLPRGVYIVGGVKTVKK